MEQAIIKKGKFSVLPATIDLAAMDHEFRNTHDKEKILYSTLKIAKDSFDFILIDCPPSLGLLTLNALAAAHEVYIPVQTEFLALQGLGQLIDTLLVVTRRINPELKIGGIIGTRFNRRKINKVVKSTKMLLSISTKILKENFKIVIRENVALTEAPTFGLDIYSHNPDSIGAKDYFALCKEILKREVTQ